jgi:hypothetical protein
LLLCKKVWRKRAPNQPMIAPTAKVPIRRISSDHSAELRTSIAIGYMAYQTPDPMCGGCLGCRGGRVLGLMTNAEIFFILVYFLAEESNRLTVMQEQFPGRFYLRCMQVRLVERSPHGLAV